MACSMLAAAATTATRTWLAAGNLEASGAGGGVGMGCMVSADAPPAAAAMGVAATPCRRAWGLTQLNSSLLRPGAFASVQLCCTPSLHTESVHAHTAFCTPNLCTCTCGIFIHARTPPACPHRQTLKSLGVRSTTEGCAQTSRASACKAHHRGMCTDLESPPQRDVHRPSRVSACQAPQRDVHRRMMAHFAGAWHAERQKNAHGALPTRMPRRQPSAKRPWCADAWNAAAHGDSTIAAPTLSTPDTCPLQSAASGMKQPTHL